MKDGNFRDFFYCQVITILSGAFDNICDGSLHLILIEGSVSRPLGQSITNCNFLLSGLIL